MEELMNLTRQTADLPSGRSISFFVDERGDMYMSDIQLAVAFGYRSTSTVRVHRKLRVDADEWHEGREFVNRRGGHPELGQTHLLWTRAGIEALSCRCDKKDAEEFVAWLGVKNTQQTTTQNELYALVRDAMIDITEVWDEYSVEASDGVRYRVDMWLPELRLAIEIDESFHAYDQRCVEGRDEDREQAIEACLGCVVVRHRIGAAGESPGALVAKILQHIMEMFRED